MLLSFLISTSKGGTINGLFTKDPPRGYSYKVKVHQQKIQTQTLGGASQTENQIEGYQESLRQDCDVGQTSRVALSTWVSRGRGLPQ